MKNVAVRVLTRVIKNAKKAKDAKKSADLADADDMELDTFTSNLMQQMGIEDVDLTTSSDNES